MFIKYQHVERFGSSEVEGIEFGLCHIFPKIDGTNGSIWFQDGGIHFGSRNKELVDHDNAGFKAENSKLSMYNQFFSKFPNLRLYGEWLVPHSLKTYNQDAWRKFYVFDVAMESYGDDVDCGIVYFPYEQYSEILDRFGIEYIPPLAVIRNPSYERLLAITKENNYLMDRPDGVGEGIVIKRYDFINKYGRTTWAKIVTSDFKVKHTKEMGPRVITEKPMVEQEIIDRYLTQSIVEKVHANISVEMGGWSSKYIPRLLGTVFHDMVTEELWHVVSNMKNPTINFKTLQYLAFVKTKELLKIS